MLAILSPAKTMKFDYQSEHLNTKMPEFISEASRLVKELKKYSKPELMKLMSISEKLAELNTERFKNFKGTDQAAEKSAAIFAFRGDVYLGLDAVSLRNADLQRIANHLRILSGLYGLLEPGDLIEPYRLEMGTSIKIGKSDHLYQFWGNKLTKALQRALENTGSKYIANLASNEYSKAIDHQQFKERWIDVDFREMRGGKLRFISFNAKKARGMMARYIIQNQCREVEELKGFNEGSYIFDKKGSESNKLLFVKPE
ncbi:MAG: peroxide stress protein YaaA [Saprospirales bacterium]|jgi:cytoplasmic iron level regulating protein YaaA (DUF328/UPF0246 family)|nr:MAG: peroxide stress protein YaaA [Saprospirales bacterium]